MTRKSVEFLFLNVGHFYDHLFVLLFATVAAVTLADDWGLSYGALITYAAPGFIAFGLCALPAGWLADKWSREGMMAVFFFGIGGSSMLTALANTPLQIGAGLFLIGAFAAIYHPVGIAMVIEGRAKTGMAIAVNGVFGNMGIAAAALIAGFLIDAINWQAAFFIPGVICVATGIGYVFFLVTGRAPHHQAAAAEEKSPVHVPAVIERAVLGRLLAIVFISTAVGGLLFQGGTFALPKVFDERLTDIAGTATLVGWYAFVVFTIAAFSQLVVGHMVDRYSIRTVFALTALLQLITFAAMVNLSGVAALLVSVGFMLGVFGQIPINDVLVGRVAKSEWRSRLLAMRYIVSFSVSASAIPLIGWIHASHSFSVLFQILAAAAGVTLVAVLMLPSTEAVTGRAQSPAE